MLPDQSHARTEDWTVFFLYHEERNPNLVYHIESETRKQAATKYYVLNLVNTKFTKDVKRGAIVKAMCIITPHPFFHVFKPLLLLSLDEYFKSPSIDSLKKLYNSINSIDLSQIPKFSFFERQILSSSSNPDMFIEKFQERQTINSHFTPSPTSPTSLSSVSSAPNNHINFSSAFSPATTPPLSNTLIGNHSSIDLVSSGYNKSSNGDKPLYYLDLKSNGQRLVARNVTRDTHFYESRVQFNDMKIPIKVPTDFHPESVGDFSLINLIHTLLSINQPFNTLHPELTIYGAFTPPLLVLINSLLTQKRILFVGLNNPSGEVSDRVLAACSLASGGILRSFTTHAFPYTDLSKVDDLLSSPGYVAGVKNPAFGHHPEWWDILIDLENNQMKISPAIGIPGPPISVKSVSSNLGGSGSSVDKDKNNAYYQQTIAAITNQDDLQLMKDLKNMVEDHFAESSVRNRCREYIKRFVRIASNYEEDKFGKTALWPSDSTAEYDVVPGYGYCWTSETQKFQDFQCYAPVIEGWRESRSYKYFFQDLKKVWQQRPKKLIDFEFHLDRLQTQNFSIEEAGLIYTTLADNVQDDEDIIRFLASIGTRNLYFIGYGLFHPISIVQETVIRFLHRIQGHPVGRHFFNSLSPIYKITYSRMLAGILSNPKMKEVEDGLPHREEHGFQTSYSGSESPENEDLPVKRTDGMKREKSNALVNGAE